MNKMKPALFEDLRSYNKEQLVKDIVAGIIVAIIALPLSIALALASGVGPEQGIYTAIVAGFLIAFFGGSKVQISGPTAAFATIVAGIVAKSGMEGLILATLFAGVFLILMGILKFGTLIKFIPYTITTGFTAGIAVTIFIGQWKDFFGVTYANGESPIETIEKAEVFFHNISSLNVQAMLVGIVCLLIVFLWPRVSQKIPGSLIAVIAGVVMVKGLNLQVNTIGDLYTISNSLPSLNVPAFSLSTVQEVMPDAFTIAILAAIESLLSCVVADGMINAKHNSNMELVAQGIGNIGSALFGGIPATGAIARTAANVKSGGRTPVAGIVHSIVLLLVLIVLMPYAALIPMPTIAAILFQVAYNMCQWKPFLHLTKTAPKSDIAVLVLTFVLTVVFDLVVAIEFGMLLAVILFLKRMSEEAEVKEWKYLEYIEKEEDKVNLLDVPFPVKVYEINGPMFFGVAGLLGEITVKEHTKCLILRMRSVPALDVTAMNALEELFERCEDKGIKVLFSHVNEQPMNTMKKAGFVKKAGEESFLPNITKALEKSKEYC